MKIYTKMKIKLCRFFEASSLNKKNACTFASLRYNKIYTQHDLYNKE